MADDSPGTRSHIERVFRESYGAAVATLIRVVGDVDAAEDAVQDAFIKASTVWERDGVPPNPAGWIVTTARNRAIDQHRRTRRGQELHDQLARGQDAGVDPAHAWTEDLTSMQDDQLRLIFTCCHPALRMEHRVALTLRLVGGLDVDEIARSFVVSEQAMAKRLTRAKYKISAANIPYRVPSDAELPGRLTGVLTVLSLIATQGADSPDRSGLRADALRMCRSLRSLMPDEPEVAGLLALLLLNESRIAARFVDGDIVALRYQDRTKWTRDLIDEGQELVLSCVRRNRPGVFQFQAAIQAVHADAPTFEATDWPQILALYDQLMAMHPTPVVALNRAIAIGETEGADAMLDELDQLTGSLDSYHLFHASRGTALKRLGRDAEATVAFERSIQLASNEQERRYLERQIPR